LTPLRHFKDPGKVALPNIESLMISDRRSKARFGGAQSGDFELMCRSKKLGGAMRTLASTPIRDSDAYALSIREPLRDRLLRCKDV
jgi:hypothetical protein